MDKWHGCMFTLKRPSGRSDKQFRHARFRQTSGRRKLTDKTATQYAFFYSRYLFGICSTNGKVLHIQRSSTSRESIEECLLRSHMLPNHHSTCVEAKWYSNWYVLAPPTSPPHWLSHHHKALDKSQEPESSSIRRLVWPHYVPNFILHCVGSCG